jgi:large subunit ribosomal protein L18
MDKAKQKRLARQHRHTRVRQRVMGTTERPRLCVYRSLNHIYAQIIDDTVGRTLASATTLDADVITEAAGKDKTGRAKVVGQVLARRALEAGIRQVVFDRGGYLYHGRVEALAAAAREGGLEF